MKEFQLNGEITHDLGTSSTIFNSDLQSGFALKFYITSLPSDLREIIQKIITTDERGDRKENFTISCKIKDIKIGYDIQKYVAKHIETEV